MHLTDLAAPVLGHWLRAVQADLDLVPHPTDVPRQVVAGPNPDRVLLLGNGPVIGFGVRSQELALPGHLARRLSAATGRGAVVDVVSQRGLRVEHPGELLRRCRPSAYDAVVLAVGVTDAAVLLPARRWRAGLAALLTVLKAAVSPATRIVVLPIRPVQRTEGPEKRLRPLVDRQAARFDRIAGELCRMRPGFDVLPADDRAAPRSPADYDAIAVRLAALLARRLDALAEPESADTARARRQQPDPEPLRQAALDRAGLLGRDRNPALDRLVQAARDLFGSAGAAVALVDGDRITYRAAVGLPDGDVPRSVAPCDRTIRREGPHVVPDLAGQPIARDGWRFYAGHPLESPDGFRIGTLCILDRAPRPADSVNRTALIELAARIQAELWAEIAAGRAAPGGREDGVTRPVLSAVPD